MLGYFHQFTVCLSKPCDFYSDVVVLVAQLCPTVCNPMDCSRLGCSVHGILQARILEWVAIPFSRESSDPGLELQVSCIAGIYWVTSEALDWMIYIYTHIFWGAVSHRVGFVVTQIKIWIQGLIPTDLEVLCKFLTLFQSVSLYLIIISPRLACCEIEIRWSKNTEHNVPLRETAWKWHLLWWSLYW